MMINNAIHSYQNVQYVSKPDANIAADSADGTNNSLPVAAPTTVSVSDEAQQMRAKERDIASRYDVTNMSENEKVAMAKELRDSNLIDDGKYLMMSVQLSKIKEHVGVGIDPNQKTNNLANEKSALEFAKLQTPKPTATEIAIREDSIAFLERLAKLNKAT